MIPRLAVIIAAALSIMGCFPYNWHEQELQKADDALQACRQQLEQAQSNCWESPR